MAMLKRGKHLTLELQDDFNKYGVEAFESIILEECDIDVLSAKEAYYMTQHMSVLYNKTKWVHSHSEETKRKISETNKAKGIKPPSRKGITYTEEQLEKKRQQIPWNKGKKTGQVVWNTTPITQEMINDYNRGMQRKNWMNKYNCSRVVWDRLRRYYNGFNDECKL